MSVAVTHVSMEGVKTLSMITSVCVKYSTLAVIVTQSLIPAHPTSVRTMPNVCLKGTIPTITVTAQDMVFKVCLCLLKFITRNIFVGSQMKYMYKYFILYFLKLLITVKT